MEVQAKLRYFRVSPRKMRCLVDQIRGKQINTALHYLKLSPRKRVAQALSKLLQSAVSNAKQKGTLDLDLLYVKSIWVGPGPTLKRFMARAKGSASPILKRTSHVFLTLGEQ